MGQGRGTRSQEGCNPAGFSVLPGRLSPASSGPITEASFQPIPVNPDIHPHRCTRSSTDKLAFSSDGSGLVISLESGRVCLKPYLYYFHRRHLFGVTLLFVYSLGRLKYSILCAITAEHRRVLGNIKRARRAA